MANYAQTSKNFTGAFMIGLPGVNTGSVIPWSSASVPAGFLECNGQAVSRSTYADLFAIISTTYGAGDGTTTFNVPDLTDRTVVNKSNNKSLAQTGGANTVASSGNASATNSGNTTLSTAQIASHTHGQFKQASGFASHAMGGNQGGVTMQSTAAGGDGAHSHGIANISFTGDATSVLQPYLVLIYIIKT